MNYIRLPVLAGLIIGSMGFSLIGCTSPMASSVPASSQTKSNEKELIAQSPPVTRNDPDSIAEPAPIGDQIENGDYGIGNTDLGLEVDGDRFRVYSQPGKEPWQDLTNLKYVKKGVVFDGKNYWCLTTMRPQGKMPSCKPDGWKVAKAYVPPTPKPNDTATSMTRKQAIATIAALPEIGAWREYVNQKTAGKVRTTLSINPETPITYAGREYWSVSFYENQPTHNSRWQTFLVRLDGQEILVDDLEGKYRSLETWRRDDKPMERVNPSKPIVSP